jgi:predicted DNA-binding protein with PD1-like motif
MKTIELSNGWLLRLDAGDEFLESLRLFASSNNVKFAAIMSGVGMIERARMGFFCIPKNDYDTFNLENGPYDLSNVSGNISLLENQIWPHVHIVTNKNGGETCSGHVLEAICHITAEIFIVDYSNFPVVRKKSKNLPASRLDNV